MVFLVPLFGFFGGLISWILSNAAGDSNQLNISNISLSIAATMAIGAAASWFAVYYALPVDLQQKNKVLALALAFGIFWHPVLDGMKQVVDGISLSKVQTKLQKQKQENLGLKESSDNKLAGEAINQTVGLLEEASKKASSSSNAARVADLQRTSNELLDSLTPIVRNHPAEASPALTRLATTAIDQNQRQLANNAVQALQAATPVNCYIFAPASEEGCAEFKQSLNTIHSVAVQKSWGDLATTTNNVDRLVYSSPAAAGSSRQVQKNAVPQ